MPGVGARESRDVDFVIYTGLYPPATKKICGVVTLFLFHGDVLPPLTPACSHQTPKPFYPSLADGSFYARRVNRNFARCFPHFPRVSPGNVMLGMGGPELRFRRTYRSRSPQKKEQNEKPHKRRPSLASIIPSSNFYAIFKGLLFSNSCQSLTGCLLLLPFFAGDQ